MAPSKRERELAAKRQARWEAKQLERRRRRRRLYQLVAAILALGLIGGALAVALGGNRNAQTPPQTEPTPPADQELGAPNPSIAENRVWQASLRTSAGEIGLELDGVAAPQAVANFVYLARAGFFDNTPCHRLVTQGIFVLQCGDPTGDGTGGPGWNFGPIENAPANDQYPAGTLAMARRGGDGNSMGSQFFLVYEDSQIPSDAAGGYTVFGHITSGLEVVQAIAEVGVAGGGADGRPATAVTIEGVDVR